MSEPYVSQIEAFAFNFAPRNWLQCNGQLLPINQYQALFSLLGTTFGGNGVSTFQLPDMRGRLPVGMGQGAGLSDYPQGTHVGVENVTILLANMPSPHTHTMNTNNATVGGASAPSTTAVLSSAYDTGQGSTAPIQIYSTAAPTVAMAALPAQGGSPHTNLMPGLAVNYCMCISGVFPSRN